MRTVGRTVEPHVHALTGAYVCHALAPGEEHDFEQHLAECPDCAMEFTRNQWYGMPQADDYPGGPLDRFRFRKQ